MKKLFMIMSFLFLLSLTFSCQQQAGKIEKIMEDGVEVVINHFEPHKIKNEPTSLTFDEVLIIDLERNDIAGLGISDITGFNVDSRGSVYLGSFRSSENFIFKFDENGKYVSSFCREGQGPGEVQGLGYWRINEDDELLI